MPTYTGKLPKTLAPTDSDLVPKRFRITIPPMNSYEYYRRYWKRIAEAHDCVDLTDAFVQLTELKEINEALENRCKVAEDLNKVYVRMYLEMQQKYDDLAQRLSSMPCCSTEQFLDSEKGWSCYSTCIDEDELFRL